MTSVASDPNVIEIFLDKRLIPCEEKLAVFKSVITPTRRSLVALVPNRETHGEGPGHAFRGNQHTGGIGGSGKVKGSNETDKEGTSGRAGGASESSPLDRGSEQGNAGAGREVKDLEGLPGEVKVDGKLVKFGAFAPAHEAARAYMAKAGLEYNPPKKYAKVDKARAEKIADAFDQLKHDPNDPETVKAYRAMIDETSAQYEAMLATGIKVEFIKGDDPYGNPRNMILDVVENNRMYVFPTDDGFGSSDFDPKNNPLLEFTKFEISGRKARANDIFRAVHDYFGHVKNGVGFRADGEENAWRAHSSMFSKLARRAMTTETRGQNSFVNFSPRVREHNKTASPADTIYADQKIGLLPDWVVTEGAGDD